MARTIAKDHDQKRAHILKVAAKVFAAEGFDRASMTVLAKACGVSKANIYHYYSGKDALLFDVLDSYLRALRDRVCGLELAEMAPEAQLRALLREILLAYQGADDEHRVQSSGIARLPEAEQQVLRGYQRDMVAVMKRVVAANAPELFAEDAARLHETTMSIFGMLNWYYMWQSAADQAARLRYADVVADLVLNGITGTAGNTGTAGGGKP
ncbi:TetR/AcrR family transcriptional regulator [Shimia sp. R9_2]|uniref:TetR/AcrR family transcriptional regulator n=1 Tax=Shimia sp. R9_2 TaxID=2821112 RepID=UPI001AD98B0C|nr:TetR/AcrR family transcriptional regulator [Shimia sp. R9_2]MBO9397111.1 TetR/AcrR family transcriptional regulator [Shimia sp. R9_2]